MADFARHKNVRTAVGFNYLKNPMVALAREIIASGEIGEIVSFRGIHAEDFMADRKAPFTWRLDRSGGYGAIADLGSHIISIARFLVGPINRWRADGDRDKQRPVGAGSPDMRAVEVDDEARALCGCRWRYRIDRGELGRRRSQDDAGLRNHRFEGHDHGRP